MILYFNMFCANMKHVIMEKSFATLIVTIKYCGNYLDLFNIL